MQKHYFKLVSGFLLLMVMGFGNKISALPVGWSYYQIIQVTENSGSTITNYQMRLTVNTQAPIAAGHMQANGNDIRFGKDCAGNTLYNYWIESGLNSASTVIWVKIDTLFASSVRNLYMFYGNNSASAVSAVNGTFFGPYSSTDSVASGGAGGATNSQRGFRFAPTEDLLVTSFGKREPNGSTRYVTLFNFATQAIVAQTQVSGPAAQYSYASISNPIWLTQGTQYVLELYQGASDGYYFGTSSQIGQHLTYYDMRYCNSCTQNTFPTSTLSNYHYGYPDLWYYTKRNVSPAPTAVVASVVSVTTAPATPFCSGDSTMISTSATGGTGSFTYSWTPSADLTSPNSASTMASPTVTTTFVVAITEVGGCSAVYQDSVTVTVNSLPLVVATTLTDSICMGDTADLYVTGSGANYVWQPGNVNGMLYQASPSSSTTYTVVGTDMNGCSNSATLALVVNPLPVVAVTGSYASICDNAVTPLTMTATGAANYSWMPNAATTATVTVTPSSSTTYTVTGIDTNGCMNTATYAVTLNPSPSIAVSGETQSCAGVCDTMTVTASGGTSPYVYFWSNGNTTATIIDCSSSTTCYTVTVTDANGCAAIDTVCHTIYLQPTVIAAGASAICAGDTTILNATGINLASISWSPASSLSSSSGFTVTAWPSATTTYTVVGTSPQSCTDTTTLTLVVNPLPTVTFTSALDTLCTTDPAVTLTGGSPAGGTYSGPGVTGSNFNPATAGTGTHAITYSYTDANGCSANASHTVVVDPCSGVFEQVTSGNTSVFPNPFSATITIVRTAEDAAVVNIYDMQGRIVLSQQITGKRADIDTATLPAGMYSLQVNGKKGTENFRVVRN